MRGPVHFQQHSAPEAESWAIRSCRLEIRSLLAVVALCATPVLSMAQLTNKPHVPPWTVSRPPVPSQTPQVTPGGTFSRPGSTFSPQTGTFSRPQSTFTHPASSYTPLPPIRVPVEDPDHTGRPHHPHGRRPVNLYPQTVVVHNPVVYEPYYVEVPVPVETATPQEGQTSAEAPVVIDLPPGATIRRSAAAAAATSTASPVAAPTVNPQPAGQAPPSSGPTSQISTTAQAAATPSVAK